MLCTASNGHKLWSSPIDGVGSPAVVNGAVYAFSAVGAITGGGYAVNAANGASSQSGGTSQGLTVAAIVVIVVIVVVAVIVVMFVVKKRKVPPPPPPPLPGNP